MIVLILFIFFPLWGAPVEELLQEAITSYQQGENASTFEEREQAFNRSLYLFNLSEQSQESSPGLNQALADNYFQLGEYAWAILYYQRALKINPGDSLVLSRLQKVQKKVGLPFDTPTKFKSYLWLGVYLLTVFMLFIIVWFSWSQIRKIALFLYLFFVFLYYLAPTEGILIHSTGLYLQSDKNQFTDNPLIAGSKVTILQIKENWLKIRTSNNQIGYIPLATIRLI